MGKSIWEIDQNLEAILNEIEEADGEITEEQEKSLSISKEELENKIDSYCSVIDMYNSYIDSCKKEKKRVNELQKVRENVVNKLKNVLLYSIDKYGVEGKKGNKVYETSVRKLFTKSIDKFISDEERKDILTHHFIDYLIELHENGIIEDGNEEFLTSVLNAVNAIIKAEYGDNFIEFNINDLKCIDVSININVKLSDICNNKSLIDLLFSKINVSVDSSVNKNDVYFINGTESMKNEDAVLPTVGKYVTEKSLTIK